MVLLGITFLLIVGSAKVATSTTENTQQARPAAARAVFRYHPMTEQEVITAADVIVRGHVRRVSAPYWNQDSGEIWRAEASNEDDRERPGPLPLQSVEVTVGQSLANRLALDIAGDVEFVVLGMDIGRGTGTEGESLAVGNEVVVLLERRELAWRENSRRSMLTLAGAYQGVYEVLPGGKLRSGSRMDPGRRSQSMTELQEAIEGTSPGLRQ